MLRYVSMLVIIALTLFALTACNGSSTVLLGAPVNGAGDTKAPTIAVKNLEEGGIAIPGEPFTVAVTDESSTLGEIDIVYNGRQLLGQSFNSYAIAEKYEVGGGTAAQILEVRAQDAAGNESAATIHFTVIDTRHAQPDL